MLNRFKKWTMCLECATIQCGIHSRHSDFRRDEYHYKDCFGKERIISSYRLEMTARIVGNVRKHWENA